MKVEFIFTGNYLLKRYELNVLFNNEVIKIYSVNSIASSRGACDACMNRIASGLSKINIHHECNDIPRYWAWAWKAGAMTSKYLGVFGYNLIPLEYDKTYSLEVGVCPRCFSAWFEREEENGHVIERCEVCGLIVNDNEEAK